MANMRLPGSLRGGSLDPPFGPSPRRSGRTRLEAFLRRGYGRAGGWGGKRASAYAHVGVARCGVTPKPEPRRGRLRASAGSSYFAALRDGEGGSAASLLLGSPLRARLVVAPCIRRPLRRATRASQPIRPLTRADALGAATAVARPTELGSKHASDASVQCHGLRSTVHGLRSTQLLIRRIRSCPASPAGAGTPRSTSSSASGRSGSPSPRSTSCRRAPCGAATRA